MEERNASSFLPAGSSSLCEEGAQGGLLQIMIDRAGWIEVQGPPEEVDAFLQRMEAEGSQLQIHINQWCG